MTTGELIKKRRKELGYTQKELGEKIGVTQQQIGQYENGQRNPKKETLAKIAEALDCDISLLKANEKTNSGSDIYLLYAVYELFKTLDVVIRIIGEYDNSFPILKEMIELKDKLEKLSIGSFYGFDNYGQKFAMLDMYFKGQRESNWLEYTQSHGFKIDNSSKRQEPNEDSQDENSSDN